MEFESPASARRADGSARAWRASRRSPRERGSWRGPQLCLHISGGLLSWAVVTGAAVSELLSVGSLRAEPESLAAALTALVAERRLPCAGARLTVPGVVRIVDAAEPPAPIGAADIALGDGRRIRAEIDAGALSVALTACAAAGIEVVSVEPEALPLARSLAVPAAATPPDSDGRPGRPRAVAAVWVAASCTVVVRSCGDEVELVGLVPSGTASASYLVAPAAARLIVGAGVVEAVVAGGDDPADLAARIAFATSLPVRVGDPLARIPAAGPLPLDAVTAAGAVGLAVEARGLPRVDIPVRWPPPVTLPELAEPDAVALPPPVDPVARPAPPAAAEPVVAERTAPNRTLVLAVAAVLVVGALVAAWSTIERGAARDRQAVLVTLQTQLAAIPRPTAPTRRLLVLGADRRARIDAIALALGRRVAWDRILREVSAVLPADLWLTGFVADGGARADDVRLRGYATDQAGVALALTRLALVADLADVRLERSERVLLGGRQVARFSIVVTVRAGVR
jgi:Tfp pilus assembly protein PilN